MPLCSVAPNPENDATELATALPTGPDIAYPSFPLHNNAQSFLQRVLHPITLKVAPSLSLHTHTYDH